MSPTAGPTPSPTAPSPTMSGTTRMTTSGVVRAGAVTTTTPASLPRSTMLPLMPRRARSSPPMSLLGTVLPRPLATTTTLGPSRPMARTTTTDGASLTTPSRLATTLTSTTPVRFALMTTSGLRTAMVSTRVTTTSTAAPLPLRRALVTLSTAPLPPRARAPTTGPALPTTGMPGAAIRTSTRRSLMTTLGPSPTLLSLTTSGTTVMPTSGAARPGARTRISMVPPLTATRLLPRRRPTTSTARSTVLVATATATARATVPSTALPAPLGLVLPLLRPLPRLVTTTTLGPSRLTARTRMPDGASLTIPSLPDLTITRSTPDGFRLMMTSGLRTTTPALRVMPTSTARLLPSGPSSRARAGLRAPSVATPTLPPGLVLSTTTT